MFYVVIDKDTKEEVSPHFGTREAAKIWCQGNGVDYDFYKIITGGS